LDLENNERLELLGDSVLDVVITERLMMDFPQEREGKLSQLRSAMVSERSLADLALEFRLGEFLYLGKGEKRSGGAQKPSLLANTYEAVLGAFFLDRGFEPSRQMILHHFKDRFEQAKAGSLLQDFKTRLQEFVQMKRGEVPRYVLRSQRGPDHEKTFEVVLELGKTAYGVGRGRSKKEAEQEAARVTLERLRQEHPELEKSE
jgi:ribonuclease-3